MDTSSDIVAVAVLADRRIREEALRQLDSLDLDNLDARLPSLWDLEAGLTTSREE